MDECAVPRAIGHAQLIVRSLPLDNLTSSKGCAGRTLFGRHDCDVFVLRSCGSVRSRTTLRRRYRVATDFPGQRVFARYDEQELPQKISPVKLRSRARESPRSPRLHQGSHLRQPTLQGANRRLYFNFTLPVQTQPGIQRNKALVLCSGLDDHTTRKFQACSTAR